MTRAKIVAAALVESCWLVMALTRPSKWSVSAARAHQAGADAGDEGAEPLVGGAEVADGVVVGLHAVRLVARR